METLKTEDRQNVPSMQYLSSEDEKFVARPPLKIKSCSPYDASSNLEFTNKSSKLYLPRSLANIRPHEHSVPTPHKFHNQISISRPQALKSPPKKSKESPHTANRIIKEISDTEIDLPLWKIWPGNNRFYFNGRLMTGPKTDKLPNTIAWLFVIGINVIFFGVAFPFLVEELTALLPVLSTYLCLSTVILFLLTSFTDPGIIPRKCVWELNGEVPQPFCSTLQRKDTSELSQMSDSQKKFVESSSLKFCTICQIYKPQRAVHCKHCGNCVEVSGGHRFFVNNCIGKRNYRFFVGFITSLILMALCHLACWIILILFSLGVDIGPDPDPSFSNRTSDIVLFAIVGAPTGIFCAIKLGLIIACLFTKAKKRTNKAQNYETKNKSQIEAKRLTVDWSWSEPSRIKARELLSRVQLQKYKVALSEGQEEAIV